MNRDAMSEGFSTKDWFLRMIPFLLLLGILFGWNPSDHNYLEMIFFVVLVAMFEGEQALRHLREEQRQNKLLLERVEQEQRQHRLLLERFQEEQRQHSTLLDSVEAGQDQHGRLIERLLAEQEKLGRQQTRKTIVLEGILAKMPVALDSIPGDDSEST